MKLGKTSPGSPPFRAGSFKSICFKELKCYSSNLIVYAGFRLFLTFTYIYTIIFIDFISFRGGLFSLRLHPLNLIWVIPAQGNDSNYSITKPFPDGSGFFIRNCLKNSRSRPRARRQPMKKRSIQRQYVSILKRLATQPLGVRCIFEIASSGSNDKKRC